MTTVNKTKAAADQALAINEELAERAKEFAGQTVDKAQEAAEKAGEIAHLNVQVFDASANAFKNNAAELQLKAIEFTQANLNSMFEFGRKLIAADKPETAVEASRSFAADFTKMVMKQAGELNSLSFKLAQESAKPVQENALKSFEAAKKTFAA